MSYKKAEKGKLSVQGGGWYWLRTAALYVTPIMEPLITTARAHTMMAATNGLQVSANGQAQIFVRKNSLASSRALCYKPFRVKHTNERPIVAFRGRGWLGHVDSKPMRVWMKFFSLSRTRRLVRASLGTVHSGFPSISENDEWIFNQCFLQ